MEDPYRYKVICDPVHNEIPISKLEQELIDSPSFQRLRNLKQLGLASLVYPNATHTRFAHSLGVFRLMSRVIDLFVNREHFSADDKKKLRIAALLHDIGHYPYSHLMEFLDRDQTMRPNMLRKKSPAASPPAAVSAYPSHEDVGKLIILKRHDISDVLDSAGIDPAEIASIIRAEHTNAAYNRLIHSSLDVDRMDYLVRDSLGTGVPYGRIDIDYILSNLDIIKEKLEDIDSTNVVEGEPGKRAGETVDIVLSSKAETAAEHFLVARYFMHKAVYFHKTTFGFEALLRHILFMLRDRKHIYADGSDVEAMIADDAGFLAFHDGYVDSKVQEFARESSSEPLVDLCRLLINRTPPKLLHQVAALKESGQPMAAEYALFRKDRIEKIKELSERHGIPNEFWIWEDLPKEVSFESLGPFVALSQISDLKPEETAELIRVKTSSGEVRKLVDDQNSIIHHLSKLRLQMSRLYLAKPVDKSKLEEIRAEVRAWAKPD